MWRKFMGMEEQTRAEKRAAVNGVNLFFGALIGANLGALDRLHLSEYLLLIIIVSMIVLYLQVAPVARKRKTQLAHLLAMVGGLYLLLMTPWGLQLFDGPKPPPHLFVTIALWLLSIGWLELRPINDRLPPKH